MATQKLIKSLRIESGLTQEQLSNKIGVRVQRISEWERGLHSISLDRFFKICETLNINPKSLL